MVLIYILIAVASLVLIAIVFLSIVERKTLEEIRLKKEIEKSKKYLERTNDIISEKKTEEKALLELDNLTQEFFKEYYKKNKKIDYSILLEEFENKGQAEEKEFSEKMVNLYYSSEKPSKKEIENAIKKFEEIVKKNTEKIAQINSVRIKKKLPKIINGFGKIWNKTKILLLKKKIEFQEKEALEKENRKKVSIEKIKRIIRDSSNIEYELERLSKSYLYKKSTLDNPYFNSRINENLNTLNGIINLLNELIKGFYIASEEKNKNIINELVREWKEDKSKIIESSEEYLEKLKKENKLIKKYASNLLEIVS
jgi:hypothetical protein